MNHLSLWLKSSSFRVAVAIVVLAGAACIGIAVAALHPEPVLPAPPIVRVVAGALTLPQARGTVNVEAAAEADLFATDRNAPAERYHLPDELAAKTGVLASTPIEAAKPVVLGTATAANGVSFATCQYQSDRLLMVRVGDHVGGYLVKSIERGRVTFTGPDGKSLEVLAPKAGS